jgi:hypothetical protein
VARKAIVGLIGLIGVMVVVFQIAGVRIAPSAYAVPGEAEPPTEAIEAAKSAIGAEPKVKDFTYQPGQVVEWHVGVLDDGSPRHGYAGYICQVLAEHGASTARTHVRVVDIVKVSQGENFRSASLGHVACSDFRVITP